MPSDKTAPKLGLLVIVTICLLFVMGFPLLGRAISAAGATSIFCDTITQVSKPECDALVGLYNATAGTSWTVNTDWLITTSPCSWYGVTCEAIAYPYPDPYPTGYYVVGLNLVDNNLSGSLPTEIGDLTNLKELSLGSNHLTGAIPTSVGNLTALETLYLSKNTLAGEVPASFSSLVALQVGSDSPPWTGLGLDYNMLFSSNPTLTAFLAGKDPTWGLTQTLPPTNLQATDIGVEYTQLAWTPIVYTGDGGYYEIHMATDSGGPFWLHGQTADKTASSYDALGLNASTTYYIKLRAYTPPHANPNALWSEFSEMISVTTEAYLNMLPLVVY